MDFFESQESAKRNTGKLYFLFGLAILSLIVVTNFLIMFIFGFAASEMTSMAGTQQMRFDWNQFLIIGAAVAAVVFFGSLYKIKSLSGGGARIAEMLDGKLLLGGGANLKEQSGYSSIPPGVWSFQDEFVGKHTPVEDHHCVMLIPYPVWPGLV